MITMISIPIVQITHPSKEECLAKLSDIFHDVDLSKLLNLWTTSHDDSMHGFKQLLCDLYPAYRCLTSYEQEWLRTYLMEAYTLDVDYIEYEGIIPDQPGPITKREK